MGLLCDRAQRNHAREDTPHPQPLELGMQTQALPGTWGLQSATIRLPQRELPFCWDDRLHGPQNLGTPTPNPYSAQKAAIPPGCPVFRGH